MPHILIKVLPSSNMHKTQKASILIWTMFVSLLVVSFFVAFEWGFMSFIKSSEIQYKNLSTNIDIDSDLQALKTNPQSNVNVWDLVLVSRDFDWIWYSGGLTMWEAKEFLIQNRNGSNSVSGSISWWDMLYEVISFDSWSENLASVYSSWVLKAWTSYNLSLDTVKSFNIIWVRELWWYWGYYLDRGNTDMMQAEDTYQIYKDYVNFRQFLYAKKVTNFVKNSKIDYKNFKVFLNSENYGQ